MKVPRTLKIKAKKRIRWGYPTKSWDKIHKRLEHDLIFYGAGGPGDCAMLELRHPEIVMKTRKDGSQWFQIEVDDVYLPLQDA